MKRTMSFDSDLHLMKRARSDDDLLRKNVVIPIYYGDYLTGFEEFANLRLAQGCQHVAEQLALECGCLDTSTLTHEGWYFPMEFTERVRSALKRVGLLSVVLGYPQMWHDECDAQVLEDVPTVNQAPVCIV